MFFDQFDLLDAKDFRSIVLHMTGRNNTSGIDIKKVPKIEIFEINDNSIVLGLPERSCANGHYLLINFMLEKDDNQIQFSATLMVKIIEKCENDSERVTAQLMQCDLTIWKQFVKIFQSRQNEIANFLKSVKGLE